MATEAVLHWCRRSAGDLPVVLAAGPDHPAGDDRVEVRLVSLAEATSLSDLGSRPHRLVLTYQIRVQCADPAAGHALLCDLMFAALDTPFLAVPATGDQAAPLPMTVVSGPAALARYGTPADPACLYLDLTVERARTGRQGGIVREPPILMTSQKVKRIK